MLDSLPSRFEHIIRETVGSKSKFAVETGKTAAQITDICKGRGKPTFDYLLTLSEKFKVNLNWLITGEGPSFIDQITMDDYPASSETDAAFFEQFSIVPKYDVQASAGYGAFLQSEQIVDYLAFKRSWVRSDLRADPFKLALITADGDSMEPTIRTGDLLLIDLSQTRIKKDSIYVLRMEDTLLAKRLQWLYDGRLAIRSDNPAYREQIIPELEIDHLQIVGRVVWFGRQLN